MIPNNALVQPAVIGSFLPPKNVRPTNITDMCLGGIGISDPSQGLSYQVWSGIVNSPSTVNSSISISSPNTSPTTLVTSPNITWMRLAFDQNMHPFCSFIDQSGAAYYWFDPTIPGNTIVRMDVGVLSPNCVMDDPSTEATRLNTNDIILSYILNGNLCYRQLRDRFGVEYILYAGINNIISNPTVFISGISSTNRLQFEIDGALYL